MTSYQELLSRKKIVFENKGLEIDRNDIHPVLFDFQKDLVKWALKKGRSAIFADTGLGKTFMQLGRKFIGIELKESYFKTAKKNLDIASGEGQQTLLK